MHRQVQFKVRKDLEPQQQLRVIKLKGSLISKGYTEIIHIMDQDEQYHINTFETQPDKRNEVQQYIEAFISEQNLSQTISIDYPA
jgi:AAA15 family ATPase/GTPase